LFFKKKIELIKSDKWYLFSDVLIFSETLTSKRDNLHINGYSEIFRSDSNIGRGIVCFVRENFVKANFNPVHVYEKSTNKCESNWHIELFSIKIGEITIISGYKSPRTPFKTFEKTFKLLIDKLGQVEIFVALGDFNFNILNLKDSSLHKLFNSFNMNTMLPINIPTTNLNTQIDVVFSSNLVHAGVYETFFSDHKPIYAVVSRNTEKIKKDFISSPTNQFNFSNISVNNIEQKYSVVSEKKTADISKPACNFSLNNVNFLKDLTTVRGMRRSLNQKNFEELKKSDICLTDIHIDFFNSMLQHFTCFFPQSTLLIQIPNHIKRHKRRTPNIQILFDRQTSSDSEIGHWICTYYDGEVVHIFDSMNYNRISPAELIYLEKLYGSNIQIIYHKVQNQTNSTDCGLYAIAFSVSICFGRKPCNEIYDTTRLKAHAVHMFENKLLQIFP
jgi:hypothetical protein